MSITERMPMSEDAAGSARRFEVFTGTGRRRSWTAGEKEAIVAASFASSSSVSQVARQHGLTPSQLFAWRREARGQKVAADEPAFVPAVIERSEPGALCPVIELDIGGDSVWIARGAELAMVTAVIDALTKKRSTRS